MTREDIEMEIKHIRIVVEHDAEEAHSAEDDLYQAFIKHVSNTANDELAQLAKLVLTTGNIAFPRYCG